VPRAKGIKPVAQKKRLTTSISWRKPTNAAELAGHGSEKHPCGPRKPQGKLLHGARRGDFRRGMHISPYEQGNLFNHDPLRPKKLLMHEARYASWRDWEPAGLRAGAAETVPERRADEAGARPVQGQATARQARRRSRRDAKRDIERAFSRRRDD
jgi:hypothetical protein